jgi:hypothetical protein
MQKLMCPRSHSFDRDPIALLEVQGMVARLDFHDWNKAWFPDEDVRFEILCVGIARQARR